VLDGVLAHALGQFIGSRVGTSISQKNEILENIVWGQRNQRIIGKQWCCLGRVVGEVPMVAVGHEAAQVMIVIILFARWWHGGSIALN